MDGNDVSDASSRLWVAGDVCGCILLLNVAYLFHGCGNDVSDASFMSGSPPGYICDAPLTGHHPGGLVPKCNLLFNYYFLKKIACHKHNSEGAHLFVPLHARYAKSQQ